MRKLWILGLLLVAVALSGMTRPSSLSVKPVATIADLRATRPDLAAASYSVVVSDYATEGDGGGGEYYWSAGSALTDDGGSVIAPTLATTGRWLLADRGQPVSLKQFGAKGDGATDDTVAWKAFLAYGGDLVIPTGTYKIADSSVWYASVTRDIRIIGHGTIKPSSATRYVLPLTMLSADLTVWISGVKIDGNMVTDNGIYLESGASAARGKAEITNCVVENLYATGTHSTWGIAVAGDLNSVIIRGNRVASLTRDVAGTGACQGIVVRASKGQIEIGQNYIDTILTPTIIDADGIVYFAYGNDVYDVYPSTTAEWLATSSASIWGNTIIDVEGRGIKVQGTNVDIFGNLVILQNCTTIPYSYLLCECQRAGLVNIHDNKTVVKSTATMGAYTTWIGYSVNSGISRRASIHHNELFTEKLIPYGVWPYLYTATGGGDLATYSWTIDVNNNLMHSDLNAPMNRFVNLIPSSGTVIASTCNLIVESNKLDLGNGSLVYLANDYWEDASRSEKIRLHLINNVNTRSYSGNSVLYVNSGAAIPYYMPPSQISGNTGFDGWGLTASGVELLSVLLPGSSVYFATDGGAGGFTASGGALPFSVSLARYCWIETGEHWARVNYISSTGPGELWGNYNSGVWTWTYPNQTDDVQYTTASATVGTMSFRAGRLQSFTAP